MNRVDERFKDIIQAVLSVTQPAAVILFGSHARGDAHEDSDVDLLIIREKDFKPGESRRKELGSLYRAITKTCDSPKDVVLFTKNEFFNWKNTTNHMVSIASKEGRVLYGQI
jgi:predicted nucleotidyltransferase